MDERLIEKEVLRFRKAMDKCYSKLGVAFERFPHACCGDVTELLAAYLKDEGFGSFAYVSGRCLETNSTHAWLERDGIIIDATADQFSGVSNPAMVTRDRSLHARFNYETDGRADGDFRLLEGAYHLHSAYNLVKHFLCSD